MKASRKPGVLYLAVIALLLTSCQPIDIPEPSHLNNTVERLFSNHLPIVFSGSMQPVGLGDVYYPDWGNAGYDAIHYDLALDIDVPQNYLSATETIQALALANITEMRLDFEPLHVTEVLFDDVSSVFRLDKHKLIITLPWNIISGDYFEVVIRYHGNPQPLMAESDMRYPVEIGWTPSLISFGIYTVNEPAGAKSWYAVNDHPLDKATYSYEVTVDRDYMVVCNGNLVGTEQNDGHITYEWDVTIPMASYLTTLSVGKLKHTTFSKPGWMPIDLYYSATLEAEVLREGGAFAKLQEMTEFYEQLFGPYPFDSLGFVVIDAVNQETIGLETQTMIMILPKGQVFEELVAHELAHQWFGDSVSLKQWSQVWLKKDFLPTLPGCGKALMR